MGPSSGFQNVQQFEVSVYNRREVWGGPDENESRLGECQQYSRNDFKRFELVDPLAQDCAVCCIYFGVEASRICNRFYTCSK